MSNATLDDEIAICAVGGHGLVLPLFGDSEQEWPPALRVILYVLGLGWTFMGVAIIADVFMGAIEKVTSKKKRVYDYSRKKWVTYEVWNATVANLTLMALGSSAPEILLNVIDIFAKGFFLKGLGPSTIVGSAAFNLLMIIAVCVSAIPGGEVRFIKEVPVYICTAAFSILAYLWLLVILLGISPNVVEPWEGVLTFLFFPILTVLAFVADKGFFSTDKGDKENEPKLLEGMTKEEMAEFVGKIKAQHGEHVTDDQVERIISVQYQPKRTRAQYRAGATRRMFGGKPLKMHQLARQMSMSLGSKKKVVPLTDEDGKKSAKDAKTCTVQFVTTRYAVLECAGSVKVKVERSGETDIPCRVHYKTEDGTAKADDDYTPVEGDLDFAANELEKIIEIKIIDDVAYEDDEDFYVILSEPQGFEGTCELGDNKVTVTIIHDDVPGT